MSGGRGRGGAPGEWLYRLLLRLHPRGFRERHGRDMVELFRDTWRGRVRGRGVGAALRFWIRTVAGTVRTALGQRWELATTGRAAGRTDGGRRSRETGRPGGDRDESGGDGMKTWTQDLKYAARALLRRPAYGVVVAATLAVGIGANTAVFSVLHAVLLAPLPYDRAGRIVRIYESRVDDPTLRNYLPAAAFGELRGSLTTTSAVSVVYNYQQETADLTDGDRPEKVKVLPVSRGYFEVVGEEPMLGRAFRAGEEDGESRVVVVSRRIFRSYLSGDPSRLGSGLTIDGTHHTVVGVMPAGFQDPLQGRIDLFTPVSLDQEGSDAWGNHYLTALARLRPGATVEQLRSELRSEARRLRGLSGEEELAYAVVPLRDDLVGSADTTLWLLMGAVGLVFLIACVNVAGVTLAQGAGRRTELAIRSSLGAGRGRLIRQLLLESGILALVGGAAGIALGYFVSRGLVALAPARLPGLDGPLLEAPVFLFGLAASAGAVLLFGLFPALRASGTSVQAALREGGRGGGAEGPSGSRLRKGLVVAQVGLALVLLVGAGVLLRSFQRLNRVELTVDPRNVTVFQVSTPEGRYDADARARFHRRFVDRLEAMPEVEEAGAVSWLPVGGNYHNWGVERVTGGEGPGERASANQRVVEGDYFRALGIELVRGRDFGPEDGPDDPDRVVINRSAAEALFPDGVSAVGRRLEIGPWEKEIVGVVEDVPTSVRGRTRPIVYHPHAQFADNRNWTLRYAVKLRPEASGFLEAARDALAEIDPDLVIHEPGLLADRLEQRRAPERFAMLVLAAFAAVALLLAAVGIYGVLAHSVSRRRHEIGVRMALGARARDVRSMVVREGALLAAAGVVVGVCGALVATRWLASLAFQVSVRDPAVFAGVAAGVLLVALAASWIPAVRATRADPMEAFRAE